MARKPVTPVQVQQYQTLRVVRIDADATYGAQIGVDLLMPDGTIATTAKLTKLFGSGAQTSSGPGTTDDVSEGQYNLYFTDKRAQSAVGDILNNTSDIELDYDGTGNTIRASLTETGVTAGDYGTPSPALVAFSVDVKGRLILASQAALIAGNGISFDIDPDSGAITISVNSFVPILRITRDGSTRTTRDGNFRSTR